METMKSISPAMAATDPWTIVDVRSASERAAACVPGSLHVPLEEIEQATGRLPAGSIALLCKGGTRARLAHERLARCGVEAAVIEGGMDRWMREELPWTRATRTSWSLERQVRFAAGMLVFAGTLLAALVSPRWMLLPGFVGAGLMFAGATDLCAMGNLLARMPWNRIGSG